MEESSGRARRRDAVEMADAYGGVLSRTMLRGLGIDRHMVTRAADADLWRVHGRQTVGLHTAPLSDAARYWRAVWEVGPAIAHVDGVSALLAAGLTGFTEDRVHVSIPHPARPLAVPGVRIHRVRRWRETMPSAPDCHAYAPRSPPSAPPSGRPATAKRHSCCASPCSSGS